MSITNLLKNNLNSCFFASKRRATVFVFLSILGLTACNSPIYDKTHIIEKNVWAAQNPISFEFEIQDTNKLYNIFLEVEHSTNYPYQNAYCQVESFLHNQSIQKQLRSLELADYKGNWKGTDNVETHTVKIPFVHKTQFNSPGKYTIALTQDTRNENLEGIHSLRLLVENVEK